MSRVIHDFMDLTKVNMNPNSNEEDGDESKEDDAVHKYRSSTCLKVSKFNHPAPTRQLKQQSR
ncbi:hypothetical protein RJ641_012936 [Dillenia turbinata]|uniref:Uncharacterized protein n=1 Tax=Dillenia turbinata TaxID=194707 RepID=A0AAN8V041_9MAGN